VPAGDRGIILTRVLAFPANQAVEVIKVDTSFQENWRGGFMIEPTLDLISKRMRGEKLYLLFKQRDQTKKNFYLYVLHIHDGTYVMHEIKNLIRFAPIEFQVTDHAAVIGGYFNTVPVVIHFSFRDHRSKILPGLLNESGELTQIQIYPDDSFDVLISARNVLGTRTIWIKNYDASGSLIRNMPLQSEEDKHLIFARAVKTDHDSQMIAGVYGRRNSSYSRGVFISRVDPSGYQRIQYYSYGDLQNFFKYMKAKREQRIKERIQRRKIKGKKSRFTYRFMVHEIVPHNGQFIMLGEAFYPEYKTVDRSFGGAFFRPTYYSNSILRDGRIFDGYRYTHAVVVGFDENGHIIWDNSFEINDVKTFTLEQFVKLEVQDENIALVYLFENALRTKIIQGNEVVEGKTVLPLKNGRAGRRIHEKISTRKLDYWYPNTFYASGITERFTTDGGVHRVFFINKISNAEPRSIPVEE
jgi:hypothetical protein